MGDEMVAIDLREMARRQFGPDTPVFWRMWTRSRESQNDQEKKPELWLDLDTSMSSPTALWDLFLRCEDHFSIMAMAPGTGPWRNPTYGQIDRQVLTHLVAATHSGWPLADKLLGLAKRWHLPEVVEIQYWYPERGQRDSSGRRVIRVAELTGISVEDIRERRLPEELLARGYEIDENFRRGDGLNDVIKVVHPDSRPVYVKSEENEWAIRAELLASQIWVRLKWLGIAESTMLDPHSSALRVPAVGDGDIEDVGNFAEAFESLANESRSSLQADRAQVLKRVTLRDLCLADPLDVVRFVVTNAAWGNSDRHSENIHFGWRIDPSAPAGGYGYLLPVDHGRCFLNSEPFGPSPGYAGSPAGCVTGSKYNPHQMLRPLAELVGKDRDAVIQVTVEWCDRLILVLNEISNDPGWSGFESEIDSMERRISEISSDAAGFIDECAEVVF